MNVNKTQLPPPPSTISTGSRPGINSGQVQEAPSETFSWVELVGTNHQFQQFNQKVGELDNRFPKAAQKIIQKLWLQFSSSLKVLNLINFLRFQARTFLFIVPIALLFMSNSAFANPMDGKVKSVADGDTLTVVSEGQNTTIRLACIDAPESKQTGGSEAEQTLRQLTPIGSTVEIVPVDRDQYNRVIAIVFGKNNEGKNFNVNLQMVAEGQAVVYQQYLNNCPNNREDLIAAEAFAKRMALGFWSEPNCLPGEFRRGECVAANPRSQCENSYPDICIPVGSPDLDCGEVPYRNIRVVGNDLHRFDRDGDGVGCEG